MAYRKLTIVNKERWMRLGDFDVKVCIIGHGFVTLQNKHPKRD